jgi:hypothetical protein
MIKKPFLFIFVSLLILVTAMEIASSQSWKEAEGQAAEQAGRLHEALTNYVAALQSVPEGSANDQRLRETIIKLVQKLSPPPALPEEARRFSIRGQTWIKEAKNSSDFDEAAKEFSKALRVAPWWADGYINQAVALEKTGRFDSAIRSLRLYLLAAPAAPDAEKVKEQIYVLEVRQEKAQKETAARKEEQDRKRREEETKAADPVRLAGDWCELTPSGGMLCGNDQRTIKVSGTRFEIWEMWQGGRLEFEGTIRGEELKGSYISRRFRNINCPDQPMPMQGRIISDGNRIELSSTEVRSFTRCVVTETFPLRMVLVRKSRY